MPIQQNYSLLDIKQIINLPKIKFHFIIFAIS